jgi:hypothetical protein
MISKNNKFLKINEENITAINEENINIIDSTTEPDVKEEKKVKWDRSKALCKAQKIYYLKNKEKLIADQMEYNKEYVKESWTCPCGCIIKRSAKYLHMRSPRHERRMMLISEGKNPNLRKCDAQYTCECGSQFIIRNKKTHDKCLKHVNYIKETQRLKEEETNQQDIKQLI